MGSLAGSRPYLCLVRASARSIPLSPLTTPRKTHLRLGMFRRDALVLPDRSQGVHARAAGPGPDGPLGDRGGRSGARTSVSVKKTAPPAVALGGHQRGPFLESLSRVLPSGLASRVLAAGDTDRQRIERDLHDGVQQRLTGLRIRLALAAESFQERGDTDAGAVLNGFGEEVEQAIEEVRAFARGVYPPMLASEGLAAALVSASRYAAEPIMVSARGIRRCRPEVENAVYFTCLAAIDNAAKHAGPARVSVRAWDTAQALHFTVSDTGCGFDADGTPTGAGLSNMHDRIAAVGGTLAVDSRPSQGTRLHGRVPDPWPRAAAEQRPPRFRVRPPLPADPGGLWASPGTSA
jgi:histidine kinase/histidine kinase/DNA gyrase B/HSP90-like ATPase